MEQSGRWAFELELENRNHSADYNTGHFTFPSCIGNCALHLNAALLSPVWWGWRGRGRAGGAGRTDGQVASVQSRSRAGRVPGGGSGRARSFSAVCREPERSWSRRFSVRRRSSSTSSGAAPSGSLRPGPMNWLRCPGTSTPDTG